MCRSSGRHINYLIIYRLLDDKKLTSITLSCTGPKSCVALQCKSTQRSGKQQQQRVGSAVSEDENLIWPPVFPCKAPARLRLGIKWSPFRPQGGVTSPSTGKGQGPECRINLHDRHMQRNNPIIFIFRKLLEKKNLMNFLKTLQITFPKSWWENFTFHPQVLTPLTGSTE